MEKETSLEKLPTAKDSLLKIEWRLGYVAILFGFGTLVAEGRQLSLSYYEKGNVAVSSPYIPPFMKGEEEEVDKGYMLFYVQRMGGLLPFASFYSGANLGHWNRGDASFTTATLFGSSKVWIFSLPFCHPYLELSTLGPTVLLRKGEGPRFLLQNFLGVGVELGGALGLVLDLRMMRYYNRDLSAAKEGLQVPTLLSLGCLF